MPLLKEREYARLYFSTSRNVFKEMYFFTSYLLKSIFCILACVNYFLVCYLT